MKTTKKRAEEIQEAYETLESLRVKIGAGIVELSATNYINSPSFTIHKDGDCICYYDSWENAIRKLAEHEEDMPRQEKIRDLEAQLAELRDQ